MDDGLVTEKDLERGSKEKGKRAIGGGERKALGMSGPFGFFLVPLPGQKDER